MNTQTDRQRGLEDRGSCYEPQPIGELMPAVLARHGINPDSFRQPTAGNALIFLEPVRASLMGMTELLATA
jgi:hypothetical protein